MNVDGGTTTTYRIISDQLGSPRLVVDIDNPTATPVFHASYDAWGYSTDAQGNSTRAGDWATWFPFDFAGGLYDPDTKLVRFGARDYDPEVGRWTNRDPIRFDGGQGNLYVYVGDDPVNRTDPGGLDYTESDANHCLDNCAWIATNRLDQCESWCQIQNYGTPDQATQCVLKCDTSSLLKVCFAACNAPPPAPDPPPPGGRVYPCEQWGGLCPQIPACF